MSGRGSPDNFGIWCNGSTTDFGSVCMSSNLVVPTNFKQNNYGRGKENTI